MADPRRPDIAVAPLARALLEGVDDGSGGPRRRVSLGVLPIFEDERPLQGLAGLVDWRMGGSLSALLRSGFCTGAASEAVLLPGCRTLPVERLVLLGLGPSRAFDRAAAERAGERLVALVEGLRPDDVLVAMPGRASERAVVEAVFDGLTRALALRAPRDLDAEAQRAARAVGDELRGPILGDAGGPRSARGSEPGALPKEGPRTPHLALQNLGPDLAHDGPAGPRPVLIEANSPTSLTPASSAVVSLEGAVRDPAPSELPEPNVCRWWVVADPRHEARLRRLLEGPPRAAEPGA